MTSWQDCSGEIDRVLKLIHNELKKRFHLMEDPHSQQQYAIMIHFVKSLRSDAGKS